MATASTGRPNVFLTKQALFAVLGLAAMVVAMRIDYQRYRDPRLISDRRRLHAAWPWWPC